MIAFVALAAALGADTCLKELHLRAVGLNAAAGAPLGEALGANRCLEHLTLWKNGLGGKGAKAMLAGMRMNVTLTHLVAEYRRRSGRPAPHGRGHSAEAFSANHHSHPSLSSDHFPSDRAKIKALFAASNEHVYDLVKTDRRVKTIPYGPCDASFLDSHFLETSAVLRPLRSDLCRAFRMRRLFAPASVGAARGAHWSLALDGYARATPPILGV